MEERYLSREAIKQVAEETAIDLIILASNNNTTVQKMFDHLGKSLKKINEKRQARIKLLEVESPT